MIGNKIVYSVAKNKFGSIKEPIQAGDYIKNKRDNAIYTDQLNNNTFNQQSSYTNFYSFNNAYSLDNRQRCRAFPFNKANLEINLFTKANLRCIPTIETTLATTPTGSISPTSIDISKVPFWVYYKIDPTGALFGKTYCGVNNWIHYMTTNTQTTAYTKNYVPAPDYECGDFQLSGTIF